MAKRVRKCSPELESLLRDSSLSLVDIALRTAYKLSTISSYATWAHVGYLRSTRPRRTPDALVVVPLINALRNEGKSNAEISATLGLSRTYVSHAAVRKSAERGNRWKVAGAKRGKYHRRTA